MPTPMLRTGRRSAALITTTLATIGRIRLRQLPMDTFPQRAAAVSESSRQICRDHNFHTVILGKIPERPAVLVSNHLSYIDAAVITPAVPCIPLCKSEVAGWPVLGTAVQQLGVIFIDRRDAHSGARVLRTVLRALRQGASVLNFPEGTTSDGSEVLPFKRGLFGIARIAGVPVVPVALRYQSADLHWTGGQTFLPHYLRTASREQSTAWIQFGEPLDPMSVPTAESLMKLARERIIEMRRAMLGEVDHAATEPIRVHSPWADTVLSPAASRRRPDGRPALPQQRRGVARRAV